MKEVTNLPHEPAVLARLLDLTIDWDPGIRRAVIGALGRAVDQPGVLPRLLDLTADPDPEVRLEVISVLSGAADQPEVLTQLLNLTTDPDPRVRAEAAGTLARAAGQPEMLSRLGELTEKISSDEQRATVPEALLGGLTDPGFGGRDRYEHRTAADYAYDALWGLEVAAPVYRSEDVL